MKGQFEKCFRVKFSSCFSQFVSSSPYSSTKVRKRKTVKKQFVSGVIDGKFCRCFLQFFVSLFQSTSEEKEDNIKEQFESFYATFSAVWRITLLSLFQYTSEKKED